MQEIPAQFLSGEVPLERDRIPNPEFLGFSDGSDSKEPT